MAHAKRRLLQVLAAAAALGTVRAEGFVTQAGCKCTDSWRDAQGAAHDGCANPTADPKVCSRSDHCCCAVIEVRARTQAGAHVRPQWRGRHHHAAKQLLPLVTLPRVGAASLPCTLCHAHGRVPGAASTRRPALARMAPTRTPRAPMWRMTTAAMSGVRQGWLRPLLAAGWGWEAEQPAAPSHHWGLRHCAGVARQQAHRLAQPDLPPRTPCPQTCRVPASRCPSATITRARRAHGQRLPLRGRVADRRCRQARVPGPLRPPRP